MELLSQVLTFFCYPMRIFQNWIFTPNRFDGISLEMYSRSVDEGKLLTHTVHFAVVFHQNEDQCNLHLYEVYFFEWILQESISFHQNRNNIFIIKPADGPPIDLHRNY